MSIKGKKILFIGIGFYDYEHEIGNEIKNQGAESMCYINLSIVDLLVRILLRIKLCGVAERRMQCLRSKLIKTSPQNNDVVFIIKGENLSKKDIDELKRRNPNAKFKLYLWDSLIRHSNRDLLLAEFDNISSFDRKDCENNKRLKFRPLFYRSLPSPEELANGKLYDLSFIGWMHSDRLEILRNLRDKLRERDEKYFLKLYMAPFSYFLARYLTHKLTDDDKELITTSAIPYNEFKSVTIASRAVLDISHPLQSGLTIRTIETLASGCHLLTTNEDIVNYENIKPSYYTVFNRENPVLPSVDSQEVVNIDSYYSLKNFITELFNEAGS